MPVVMHHWWHLTQLGITALSRGIWGRTSGRHFVSATCRLCSTTASLQVTTKSLKAVFRNPYVNFWYNEKGSLWCCWLWLLSYAVGFFYAVLLPEAIVVRVEVLAFLNYRVFQEQAVKVFWSCCLNCQYESLFLGLTKLAKNVCYSTERIVELANKHSTRYSFLSNEVGRTLQKWNTCESFGWTDKVSDQ